MKIGILTYHRAINDGAILQLYCLQRLLASRLPEARIEVVDYRPWVMEWLELWRSITRRPPFINIPHIRKMRELRQFINQHLPISEGRCVTDNLERARQYINKQGYDAVVVGSDTVWEMRERQNVPAAPNIYFLPETEGLTKVAFAASADPVQPNNSFLEHEPRRTDIQTALRDFDYVTVRDEATRSLLSRLLEGKNSIHFLPDPTILWNFEDTLVEPPGCLKNRERPLAGVAVSSRSLRVQFTRLLRKRGYDVLNLLGHSVEGQIELPSSLNLKQRIGAHAALDIMVTNRFHGTIFTLKLANAPVLFCENVLKWPLPNSKGRDLLRRIGAEKAVWRCNDEDKVPSELLDRGIEVWRQKEKPPTELLESLRMEAEDQLSDIIGALDAKKVSDSSVLSR